MRSIVCLFITAWKEARNIVIVANRSGEAPAPRRRKSTGSISPYSILLTALNPDPMKIIYFLILAHIAPMIQIYAGEIRVEKVPAVDAQKEEVKGVVSKQRFERTNYYRGEKRVACILIYTSTISDFPPLIKKLLQIWIDESTWVQVNLEKPFEWEVGGSRKFQVISREGSIMVVSPDAGYFENIFLKPNLELYDGPEYEKMKKSFFRDFDAIGPYR